MRKLSCFLVFSLALASCFQNGDKEAKQHAIVVIDLELEIKTRSDKERYANVFLDDQLVATVEHGDFTRLKLSPGTYSLRLECDDYVPEEKEITILNDGKQEFKFNLKRI